MNQKTDFLTAENLNDLLDLNNTDKRKTVNAQSLQNAISDYPKSIEEPIDYLNELKSEIGNILTFDQINTFCKKLNPKNDAWKMESLSEVLEMFDKNKTITLDELIIELSDFYKKQS
jgi:Rad3-related DNA helicase